MGNYIDWVASNFSWREIRCYSLFGLAEVIGSINNSEVVLHANKYNLATTNLQFKCSFPQ